MKISIRYKLLLYMLVSVLFFATLLIIANTFLVEKYHLQSNKNELVKTGKEIEKAIEDAEYDFDNNTLQLDSKTFERLTMLERSKGQSLFIGNKEGFIFYPFNVRSLLESAVTVDSSYVRVEKAQDYQTSTTTEDTILDEEVEKWGETGLNYGIPSQNVVIINNEADEIELDDENQQDMELSGTTSTKAATISISPVLPINRTYWTGNYEIISTESEQSFFALTDDYSLKMRTLSYQRELDNGLVLVVSTPMSVISDGVAISNQFSTIIGVITMLFTILWSLFISYRFTKPIKKMNQVTSKMAELDFTEKLGLKGKDEIAQLAGNVNLLSDKLDGTINELNLKNTKLAEDIDKERRIDKMRRDFISNVSHELKTPIFLIQGYADGLKYNISKEQGKKDFYCDVIIEEADKMNTMVKDLLDLAKIETDTLELYTTDVDINRLIGSILSKYKLALIEKNIELRYEETKDIFVKADPVKVEQVISNYINNAIEYVDDPNIIEITVKVIQEHKARISVYNTGKGIPPETQKLIWNSFYKADEARTRDIGGAGLGLSIVKSIVEAHDNSCGVHNERDGVVFWFELDLSD